VTTGNQEGGEVKASRQAPSRAGGEEPIANHTRDGISLGIEAEANTNGGDALTGLWLRLGIVDQVKVYQLLQLNVARLCGHHIREPRQPQR